MLVKMALIVLFALTVSDRAFAERFSHIVGAATGGDAILVKQFRVSGGSVVSGVELVSNDLRTTFPKVRLLAGDLAVPLSSASELAAMTDVRAVDRHRTLVSCPPVRVDRDTDVLVAVHLPASTGVRAPRDGAGVLARVLAGKTTSYFAPSADALLGAMDVDYAIELVYETVGKGSPQGEPEPSATPTVHATYLDVGRPLGPDGTRIEFGVANAGPVELVVYDVAGRRVRMLVNEVLSAGRHERTWDGRDSAGSRAAAGVYILRLEAAERVLTRKLVRAK
jgi:hypothetical protein